jgi:hypothetical protein
VVFCAASAPREQGLQARKVVLPGGLYVSCGLEIGSSVDGKLAYCQLELDTHLGRFENAKHRFSLLLGGLEGIVGGQCFRDDFAVWFQRWCKAFDNSGSFYL